MPRFDELLRHSTINALLREAGVDPSYIKDNRSFTSRWSWDDGKTPVATVWREELSDLDTTPWHEFPDLSLRTDLVGSRKKSATELYAMLVRHVGQPIRVILQRRREDETTWSTGVTQGRGLDPEPWFPSIQGQSVLLQRGSVREPRLVAIDGMPMPLREPKFSERETRPEQIAFRRLVGAKSNNLCALTGAPPEVCDAAHFAWAYWRVDNQAHHGVLLRRDLHAALDAGLLAIAEDGMVSVSRQLADAFPPYAELHGRRVLV